jgi:uncharacterized membrane protein
VPNGDLAHVLLFGGFTAFALVGMWAIDMRFKRTLGADEWRRLTARTSIVPFAAVLSGRWRPSGVNIDAELVMRLLGAAALYAMLLSLHEPTIGVAPFPAWPP